MSRLHLLWRVIYHSLYYFLSLILLLILCVTPADVIRQSYYNTQRYHILIIIICLSVALAAVVCIYFFRLYVNRTSLANIPKLYIPIDKGDVRKKVRKMIVASLSRSAAIAWESRPRARPAETASPPTATTQGSQEAAARKGGEKNKRSLKSVFALKKATSAEEKMGITLPPVKPVWGEIEHYGWASPNSSDLPNLQYSTVICELPSLIEAKALTLAPPAPKSTTRQLVLDPQATALLQRRENQALRQYLAQLAELGVLAASRTTADFLASYDYARYSTRPISNSRFRELMHLFAEILRSMQPLDSGMLASLGDAEDDGPSESDIDNDAPQRSPSTPRSRLTQPSLHRQDSQASRATIPSPGSSNSNGSQVRRHRPTMAGRNSSQGTRAGTYRTAPTTPKSKKTVDLSPTSSLDSFAQTRAPYDSRQQMSSSSASIASGHSGGSVIRLAESPDSNVLPYVLTLTDTGQ